MRPETFTKEQATDLSRGFPHLCRIVDGHPDDGPKKIDLAARKAAFTTDPIYGLDWPREVAGRFLRAFALGRPGSHANLGGDEAAAEVAKPGWPVAKDVPRIVRSIVFPPKGGAPAKGSRAWGRHSYPFEVAAVVYLLEAACRPPTARQIEAQYDALMDQLVSDLEAVRGDRRREEEALVRAAQRFMEIRAGHDGEPTENLTHFFGADGVGHEKSRPTALARLEATAAETKRWMSVLAVAG